MNKNSEDKNNNEKKKVEFDENMFPIDERFNAAPNVRPFTKFRGVEMVLCVAAVVMGLLYLYTETVTLSLLLPCYSVGMAVITVLRYLDVKKSGGKGVLANIPVVFSGLLTVLVIFVTALYFRK